MLGKTLYGQWKGIVGGESVGTLEVFGAHHGRFIPSQSEIASSYGSFFLAGPGIIEDHAIVRQRRE